MTRMAPPNKMLDKHWNEQRERIKHGQVLGRDPLNPAPTTAEPDDESRMSLFTLLARALARRGTE